jgi:AcrR family transcriptional regulator
MCTPDPIDSVHAVLARSGRQSYVKEPGLQRGSGVDRPPRRSLLRQERSKETRRLLIRTAARLWSERGYDAVTVEEVCSAAGVGRTTFYLHFESKEQLLVGLAAGTAMGVEADLEDPTGSRTVEEQTEIFIAGVARRMEAVPKSLAELVIRSYRLPLRTGRAEGRRFADMLAELLAEAGERRELTGEADPAELGEILGALTMDAIESWAGRDDGVGLDEVLRFRFDLVLERYRRDGPSRA